MKRAALSLCRLAPVLFACLAAIGCGDSESSFDGTRAAKPGVGNEQGSSSGGTSGSTNPGQGNAQQAIEEADIIQVQDGHLFAISKSGTLSVIDISIPGKLTLNSQVLLPGEPFEMYLNGSRLVLLMNKSALEGRITSAALVLDVRDPVLIQRTGTFPVAGAIVDSRLAGDTLYLVTENGEAGGDATLVTTFDLAIPAAMKQVDQLPLAGSGKHSIIFGNGRMYVGGESGIDLVDVSDAKGKLQSGTHVDTAGPITARWQMSEKDEVLRVITQGAGEEPAVETFVVWNARSMQPMAKTNVQLPVMEDLKAVRFDADRAYLITFRQTDPLFIVDLSDPANPQQRGELVMPGWVVHLEPRGNRLIGLGVDPSSYEGMINVSLFDVSDMDQPKMLNRVSFGETIDLAEDQDRLQKAFRIGADGLITVPYSGPVGSACESGGAVQIVKMDNDTLYQGQSLPMAGNPRRALVNQNELIAVSDSNVTSFDIATATKKADVSIGSCEVRTSSGASSDFVTNPPRNDWELRDHYGEEDGAFGCSTTQRGSSGGWASVVIGLGVVVGATARRRAQKRAA